MLPKMFVTDFGDQIGSYVTFIDTNYNQFEILVERINGSVYLQNQKKNQKNIHIFSKKLKNQKKIRFFFLNQKKH